MWLYLLSVGLHSGELADMQHTNKNVQYENGFFFLSPYSSVYGELRIGFENDSIRRFSSLSHFHFKKNTHWRQGGELFLIFNSH